MKNLRFTHGSLAWPAPHPLPCTKSSPSNRLVEAISISRRPSFVTSAATPPAGFQSSFCDMANPTMGPPNRGRLGRMRLKLAVGPKNTSIDLLANGDDSKVGELYLTRQNGFLVGRWIHVEPELRQRGWGTRLWEEGLRVARAQGVQLTSDKTRSPFVEAFWRKQAARGRAECVQPGRGIYHTPPVHNLVHDMRRACGLELRAMQAHGSFIGEDPQVWLDRCTLRKVRAALKSAPKPDAGTPPGWPCRRWGIRPTYAGSSLAGVRFR